MEEFNRNSNDRPREDELFESDSDFQLNLSLRSNFRVPTQNSVTSNSPRDLPAEAATATNQDGVTSTALTSQANKSQSQPFTLQKNSETEKDDLIYNLTRMLAERNGQLSKANDQISSLQREAELEKVHLDRAEINISDLKRELREKKGQLVIHVLAKEQATKVEKFLTTVSGELGTFVRKLNSMVVPNVAQIESNLLVLGPFQTANVKNEFIQLMNDLATHISNNSATVEVVRDFLVNINTVLNRQVCLTQDPVVYSPLTENVTPDIIECSPPPPPPPQPENLTSSPNPTPNVIFCQEQPSTKRFCSGIHQAEQTAPSIRTPNSRLPINPPPLVPTIRPAPSSSSTKQSTFQSIRATPSSYNHAQYTLQIMETTSTFSSLAHPQSTLPHILPAPSSVHTHPQPLVPPSWGLTSSPSTHVQLTCSTHELASSATHAHFPIQAQPMISHIRNVTSYPATHPQSVIQATRAAPLSISTRDPTSTYPYIPTISLISPPTPRAATPTSSTHSPAITPPTTARAVSPSPIPLHPRISHNLAGQSSSIHTQSITPPTRAIPPASSTHVQSMKSHPWASPSPSSTHPQLLISPEQTTTSLSATHTIPLLSTIPSSQAEPSSPPSNHAVPSPLQPLEVNSLTPLNYNGRSSPSISRSTLYMDHGLDLTSTEKKHGIDYSFELGNVCLCGGSFRTKATLKMHIQNHTTEGNFECDICRRRFHYPSVVKEHMMSAHKVARRHNDQRVFICYICEKDDLGSWEEFQEHLFKIHFRTPHRRH